MSEETTQKTKTQSTDQTARSGNAQGKEGGRGRGDQPRVSRYGDPRDSRGGRHAQSGNKRRGGGRRNERPRSEFDQKILSIRRVTRVVAGGRRFGFSVTMATGDRKGSIGVGVGKASDVALAIEKALNDAKKNMVKVHRTDTGSIPHDVEAKYCSSVISLRPSPGKGVVAGSAVRVLLELAGIKDVSGKIISRSKNHLNNARATLKALAPFSTPRRIRTTESQNEEGEDKRRKQSSRAPRERANQQKEKAPSA